MDRLNNGLMSRIWIKAGLPAEGLNSLPGLCVARVTSAWKRPTRSQERSGWN